jgi:hypothetical protein
MSEIAALETRRRSLVKSIVWRVIGVAWTWVGSFFILLMIPAGRHRAAWAATAIVVYHHATRMIMYYFYERLWTSIKWGRTSGTAARRPVTMPEAFLWVAAILAAVIAIFATILCIGPLIRTR